MLHLGRQADGPRRVDHIDNTKGSREHRDRLIRFPAAQPPELATASSASRISAAVIVAGKKIYDRRNEDGTIAFGINGDQDASRGE